MHKTAGLTGAYLEAFCPMVAAANHCEIAIFPSFVNLPAAVDAARGSCVEIGGQDMFWMKEGAYTGEISGEMLVAVGCRWVLAGHSERRHYFGETDETVYKKVAAALEAGLKPIVCVGEVLAEREAGKTNLVLETQLRGGIAALSREQFLKIAIAYEPVWAIGTGKTATPQIAAEAHCAIRELLASCYDAEAAEDCRILYGGSVKPDNVKELMKQDQIDGALVGGASLDPKSFAALVHYNQ
jgi:triosephosphate isomerase